MLESSLSPELKRAAEALQRQGGPRPPTRKHLEETMSPMITQSGPNAYAGLDASARKRADRLARATSDQMAALALLSMLDPEAFEIAFTAVPIASDDGDDEPIPVPRMRRLGRHLSPSMACAGSTSAAMAPPPVPSRSTSRATTPR